MSRSEYITLMFNRLGLLASTAGLTNSEASYGDELTAALRALTGDTDITDEDIVVNDLLDLFEQFMLKKLRNYYAFYVDTSVGPRKQSFSQLLDRIEARIQDAPKSVDNTYDFGTLNAYDGTSSWPQNWFEINYEDGYYR